jgi:TonB family protein
MRRGVGESIVVVLAAGLASAAKAPPETKVIDAQCAAALKLDDAHKQGHRTLADVSDAVEPRANEGSGRWISFESPAAMQSYAKRNEAPNTQAQIWRTPDGMTVALMYFQSDSGDWSHDVDYCFRADGTLARLRAVMANASENTIGERITYYATDGHEVFATAKLHDGKGKPIRDLAGLDSPRVYPTVDSLPFNRAHVSPAPEEHPSTAPAPPGNPSSSSPERELAAADVAKQVRTRLGAVKACYARALATNANLVGRVTAHWTIDLSGGTRDVTVEQSDPGMNEVGACIVGTVRRWHFTPAPKGQPVDVVFPFVFQPYPPDGGADARAGAP